MKPSQTPSLRCLIVDDETHAREFLRKRLASHSQLEVIAEASSGAEALACYRRLRPDVIFLDINLRDSDGLALPASIPLESRPAIVFVTAHEQHALEAFELNAVDYLLKPYSSLRIASTVNKLRLHFNGRIASEEVASLHAGLPSPAPNAPESSTLMVKEQNQLLQVEPDKISVINSVGDYTRLTLLTGASYLLRQSLTRWEELLLNENFFRVDRFRIINLACVLKMKRVSRNKTLLFIRGMPQPKELGRIASARLVQRLKGRIVL